MYTEPVAAFSLLPNGIDIEFRSPASTAEKFYSGNLVFTTDWFNLIRFSFNIYNSIEEINEVISEILSNIDVVL